MEGTAQEQKQPGVYTLQRREDALANPVGGNAHKKPTVWGGLGMRRNDGFLNIPQIVSTVSAESREACVKCPPTPPPHLRQ